MTKNHHLISEAITDRKYAFSKAGSQPSKRAQRRYGRRKVKECLHWGNWVPED